MDKDVAKELMEKVKEAEESSIRLETQNETIMKSLKDDYKIDDLEKAEVYLEKLDKKITKMEKEEVELTKKINDILNKETA